jgi:hypothetical protein
MLKELLLLPLTLINRYRAINTIQNCTQRRIFLFDIDNTIADTIPSFEHYSNVSEAKRVSTLAFFIKMHRIIRILKKSPNNKVIFLTARGFKSKKVTQDWLTSFGFLPKSNELFIVRNAKEKINILQKTKTQNTIYYIDDLAYLENDGKVVVYKKLINYIHQLTEHKKIIYFGLDAINTFNALVKHR